MNQIQRYNHMKYVLMMLQTLSLMKNILVILGPPLWSPALCF